MSTATAERLIPTADPVVDLVALNAQAADLDAAQRVQLAFSVLPGNFALSSSFGAQSAVMLHLLTQAQADIPVVLTDTGYLFPETYQFVDQLTERLSLNLKVYRASISPAWQEARFGQLWVQGVDGIKRYNQLNKVEPMARALRELQIGSWFAGLRRQQSESRKKIDFFEFANGRYKVHPVADWSDRDIGLYLKKHDLPWHPLWEKGYISIGDVHTTRPWSEGMREEDTRFFGLKRECGLHDGDWQI